MFTYLKLADTCYLAYSLQILPGYNFLNGLILQYRVSVNRCENCLVLFQRISLSEIKSHPWFLKNLPKELAEPAQAIYYQRDNPSFSLQSVDEIMKIVAEARQPPPSSKSVKGFGWGADEEEEEEEEDIDAEVDEEDDEDEYDKRVKEVHASGEFQIS